MKLTATCPKCNRELAVYIDLSDGVPGEAGTECDCGAIPTWAVEVELLVDLGQYLYDDSTASLDEKLGRFER